MIDQAQQSTHCLPARATGDEYIADISGLFMESHTTNSGDNLDDLHLLFDEDDPSTIVARAHSDPHVHSLDDQSE